MWRKRPGVEPSPPAKRGATDFEDREGHRAPFASKANDDYRTCAATGDYDVDALSEAGADVVFETLADTEAVLDALDGEGRPGAWTPAGAITS